MVTTVDPGRNEKRTGKIFSPVIELVGPAGAGKTSLARALASHNRRIRIIDPPDFRKIGEFPFFIWNTLSLLPTFFRLHFHHRGASPTRRESAWMATLNGWHSKLHSTGNDHAVNILDQGPIFLMAQLFYFGPECLKSRRARDWQGRMYRKWAFTLDEVFVLDASDSQLIERIHGRDKWHVMKKEHNARVSEFLAQYRIAYEGVISMLTTNNPNLKVVYFDTGRIPLDGMTSGILDEYHLKAGKAEAFQALSPG
jgi:hypothetical protein